MPRTEAASATDRSSTKIMRASSRCAPPSGPSPASARSKSAPTAAAVAGSSGSTDSRFNSGRPFLRAQSAAWRRAIPQIQAPTAPSPLKPFAPRHTAMKVSCSASSTAWAGIARRSRAAIQGACRPKSSPRASPSPAAMAPTSLSSPIIRIISVAQARGLVRCATLEPSAYAFSTPRPRGLRFQHPGFYLRRGAQSYLFARYTPATITAAPISCWGPKLSPRRTMPVLTPIRVTRYW